MITFDSELYASITNRYRFSFNGQEKDDEVKGDGNSLDFGARIYDTRLGKFLGIDLYESNFPYQSPFICSGNNPIKYIDYNGNFKIDPYFAKRYPATAKALKYYLPLMKYNKDVRDAFMKIGGFSPEVQKRFEEMITFGEGPWITPTREPAPSPWVQRGEAQFSSNSNTHQDWPNNIFIDHESLETFEMAIQTALPNGTWEDASRVMLDLVFEIMHEAGGHWNYMQTYGGEQMYKTSDYFEHGNKFTELAFSSKVLMRNSLGQYTNNSDYIKGEFYNTNFISFKTAGLTFHNFGTAQRIFSKNNKVSGTKGDPSLSEKDRQGDCTMKTKSVCCFSKSTRILMADSSFRNIENIIIGDSIISIDTRTMKLCKRKVIKIAYPIHYDIVKIAFSDGVVNKNTFDHSYFVKNKGWCSYRPDLTNDRYHLNAQKFEIGDVLFKFSQGKIEEVKIVSIQEILEKQITYTIYTEGSTFTYFANGILVHDESVK